MIIRIIFFSVIWLIITSFSWQSLVLGLPAVIIAALLSKLLASNSYQFVSVRGVFQFIGFFIVESFKGGIEIALRAFQPTLNVQPHYLVYQTNLKPGIPRILFSSTVSLLPGTLTADINQDVLHVHSLIDSPHINNELSKCEKRVQAMFLSNSKQLKDHQAYG